MNVRQSRTEAGRGRALCSEREKYRDPRKEQLPRTQQKPDRTDPQRLASQRPRRVCGLNERKDGRIPLTLTECPGSLRLSEIQASAVGIQINDHFVLLQTGE